MKIACPFVHPYVQTIVFVFRSYFAHNWGCCADVGRLAVLLPVGGAWLVSADMRPPSLGANVFFIPTTVGAPFLFTLFRTIVRAQFLFR